MITRLDERAARSVADDIERQFSGAGRAASTALQREMSTGFTSIRGLVSEFGSGLRSGIDSELRGVGGSFDAVTSKVSGMGAAGLAAVGGIAAIGTAAAVVGKQLYDLGALWDSIADGITVRTGKIGDDLKALTDVVGDVGSVTAASLGSIGDIVGQISQSMPDLAQNNGAVRQMASNLAFLDAHGQSVNIRELGKAFNAFGVNAADQVSALDKLNNVSQATGIPLNQLIATVKDGAAQFKQFGLTMDESTGLVAAFEDAGLNSGAAVTGLRTALTKVGDDARGAGPALADVITQIKALHDAGQEGGAIKLAQDTFGTRNFAPFLDAIESGKLGVEGLNKALEQTGLSIADLQTATDDGAQGFTKLKNTAETMLKPIGDFLFSKVNQPLLQIADNVDKLIHQSTAPITPDSPLGRMMLPAGGLPGMAGTAVPNAAGSALGQTTLKPYSWGTDPINPPGAAKGRTGLPGAPAVPYDATLPPGFAGLPQTAELYSAESSFLDARHSVAEKQARLNQLEHDNNATADDITKAHNDVIESQRRQNEAELRLYDTQNKQLNKHVSDLGEFGAKLDQDLGISKGLAGIADNLVRFIGNLAAAPLLGPLAAISQAQGGIDKTGSGLMGIAAAQGAFGPQYTPAGMAAAGGGGGGGASAVLGPGGVTMVPSGGGGAYPGDAALLSNVPAGRYEQTQAADLTQGIADCSSAIEDLVNIMDGRPTGGRSMATGNEAEWLQSRGFMPGAGGPGDFRVGFNSEHTQATLPGGTPFNWGSDAAAAAGGVGGTGASDPAFTSHYYRPTGAGGGGAPGGLNWDALAGKESSGNWNINSGNGYFGGLQFDQSTWEQYGGTGNPAMASKEQQIAIAQRAYDARGGGSSLWPQNFGQLQAPSLETGGGIPIIAHPGEHMFNAKDVSAMGGQGAVYDFRNALHMDEGGATPGSQPFLNNYKQSITSTQAPPTTGATHGTSGPSLGVAPGAAPGSPHAGSGATPGPSAPMIGGKDKPTTPGGGQSGGGAVGAVTGAAAMAADMFAPGSGAAVQIASQEIQRAIKFGGQVAAIGVGGLLDTFLPTGGSDLANNNWITRVASGFAGVQPQIPNVAGKSASVDAMANRPTPAAMALPTPLVSSGQGSGPAPGPAGPTIQNTNIFNVDPSVKNLEALSSLQQGQYQGWQR